jgi:hypothetical protein
MIRNMNRWINPCKILNSIYTILVQRHQLKQWKQTVSDFPFCVRQTMYISIRLHKRLHHNNLPSITKQKFQYTCNLMSETNTFIRNSRMSYHDYWLHQPPTVGQKCDLHVYFNDNALSVRYSQEMGVKVFTEPGKSPHLLQVELVAVLPPLNEDFTSGFTNNTWVSICWNPMTDQFPTKNF